ncbi:hypothetical protein Tco_0289867 [Tanacetum coccineum]
MSYLNFTKTHNLVAFLEKPTESEGFEEIIGFLNASYIRYALTINPTIFTSCIKKFWATTKVKTVNGEVQIQALVDGKKVIITELSVRRDLQFADENGTECLLNATIFAELERMGSPTRTHNYSTINITTQRKQKSRRTKRQDTELHQSSSPAEPVADEPINEENVPTPTYDPLLSETTKTTQAQEIDNDVEVTFIDDTQERFGDTQMFDTYVFDSEEVFAGKDMAKKEVNVVEKEVSTADPITTAGEVVTTVEVEVSDAPTTTTTTIESNEATTTRTTTTTPAAPKPPHDKGKGILVEDPMVEKKKPMKKLEQIRLDKEPAFKLQAEEEEEERLARIKA